MDRTTTDAAQRWSEIVERWRKSGMTARVFADKEGINASTLYGWSRKLGPSTCSSAPPATSMLLPVTVVAACAATPSSRAMLEVVLPGGEVVRVPPDVEPEQLGRVLRALRGGER